MGKIKKNEKTKNRPVENRDSIFDIEKKNATNASRVLALAKAGEVNKMKTHRWVTSEDGKTKKLVKT
jgi:hypothetical protein